MAEPMMDADGVTVMAETVLYEKGPLTVTRAVSSAGCGSVTLSVDGDIALAVDFDESGTVTQLTDGEPVTREDVICAFSALLAAL